MNGLIVGREGYGLIDLDQSRRGPHGYHSSSGGRDMRALGHIREKVVALAGWVALRERRADWAEFHCGDCERRDRCGLPPDQDCVVKAAQIARDGGRPRRRAALTQC
jgi:hypothetical protein